MSTEDSWQWLDGRKWQFEGNWEEENGIKEANKCLSLQKKGDFNKYVFSWKETECKEAHNFVCRDAKNQIKGNEAFNLSRESFLPSNFHVKWNYDPARKTEHCPGIQIDWRIENGTFDRMEIVSNQLSGTVSTPWLGDLRKNSNYNEEHEYTAVINMPNNITDILDDAALVVVDIDVTITHPKSKAELWTSGLYWVSWHEMNWRDAELYCLSIGGHLASAKSSFEWQNVETTLKKYNISAWLGGSDKRKESEWLWSDGSKMSYTNWAPGQPDNKTDEDCLVPWWQTMVCGTILLVTQITLLYVNVK